MAAENTQRADGTFEFAYLEGTNPWHGNGNSLPVGATREQWLKASGMDWKLLRTRVRYPITANPDGTPATWGAMEDRHVLVRSDTKAGLSIVSDGYKVYQPGEVFDFMWEAFEQGGFQPQTAGTLFEGRRLFANARVMPDAPVLDPADKVGGYLLAATSCDSSMASEFRFTSTCVVCNNTLQMARSEKALVVINHRNKVDNAKVRKQLGISTQLWAEFMRETKALAGRKVDATEFDTFLCAVLDAPVLTTDPEVLVEVRDSIAYRKMLALFTGSALGADLVGRRGTAWGALNAVTAFVDHQRKAGSPEKRFANAQWGSGEEVKEAARDAALALLG